jgi:ADP-heptose:LPS heptosyltransferase
MKILIDSLSRRLGDTLNGLPLASMFKQKYGGVHITYTCNPIDKQLFEHINVIDSIAIPSIYNQSNVAYDSSYDFVLRSSFDVDAKYNPSKIFGELDCPDGWRECIKNYPIIFDYFSEDIKERLDENNFPSKSRKRVGIFINYPRQDASNNPNFTIYPVGLWQKLITLLSKDYEVYIFHGMFEKEEKIFDNCINMGKLSICDEIFLMSQMDVTIGTSNGLMTFAACFAQKPLIILHSCDDKTERGVWNGIPDKCCLPGNRFAFFVMDDEDIRSFIKPLSGTLLTPWQRYDYHNEMPVINNIRNLDGIKPETILEEVSRIVTNKKGIEWFFKGDACENCDMKDNGKCLYEFIPAIKKGGYYLGGYNADNR